MLSSELIPSLLAPPLLLHRVLPLPFFLNFWKWSEYFLRKAKSILYPWSVVYSRGKQMLSGPKNAACSLFPGLSVYSQLNCFLCNKHQ